MSKRIMDDWKTAQFVEIMEFASRSPIVSAAPAGGVPPSRYIVRLDCEGLVYTEQGIETASRHLLGIQFPDDYLQRRCHPSEILTWLEPHNAFHANIRAPFICTGDIPPGMTLLNLVTQVYQIITWQRFTIREDDALNKDACSWARANMERFPVDPRRSMLHAAAAGARP